MNQFTWKYHDCFLA
jgi:hypothetical protein